MLAIAQKGYINQQDRSLDLKLSITNIKHALQAFERANRKRCIKALYKAYAALPHNPVGIRVAADIIETLLQVEAYAEITYMAVEIEREFHSPYTNTQEMNFHFFRIFSNAAQAYENLGELAQARHYHSLALDYQLETGDEIDLEMLNLLIRKSETA